MRPYSIKEIYFIISQLNDLVEVCMFQRSFMLLSNCYSAFQLEAIGRTIDFRILHISKNGRIS